MPIYGLTLCPIIGCISSLILSLDTDFSELGSRTELDFNANMIVVSYNCTIFDQSGQTYTVNVFVEYSKKMFNIPIVDAEIAYGCAYKAKSFLLLIRNVLYILELDINLLPPLIIRKACICIKNFPKFQIVKQTVIDHSMYISVPN